MSNNQSNEPSAKSDAISNGHLAYIDALVGCKKGVELEYERAIMADILGVRSIVRGHQRPIPQSVIITNHSPNFHELYQPFVILGVVILVRINKYEVEETMVLVLSFIYSDKFLLQMWLLIARFRVLTQKNLYAHTLNHKIDYPHVNT